MSFAEDCCRCVAGVCAPSRGACTGPGFSEFDRTRLEAAEEHLRALGWSVREAGNVRSLTARFAGTDAERARGVQETLLDPSADLAIALRGGYGATRILPLLDFRALEEAQAPLLGISDVTALSCALQACAGRASWQGPALLAFSKESSVRDAAFLEAMRGPEWSVTFPTAAPDLECSGVLWGGNLAMLASLAGTPWMPAVSGGILFVEDVAEPAWRIERMLCQLIDAGILGRQKALVCGTFTGAEKGEGEGAGKFSLDDALEWIEDRSGVPVIRGLPFGHGTDIVCVPTGVQGALSVQSGLAVLSCPEPPLPAGAPGRTTAAGRLWWE